MLERFEIFSQSVSSIYRYIQKIEREEMERFGLKGAYAQLLVAMATRKDGVTSAELSRLCELNRSAVSRCIGEMEALGLVLKSGKSYYRARLSLSPRGEEIASFAMERARQAVMEIGGELSDSERQCFYDVLERISKKLEKLSKDGFPD